MSPTSDSVLDATGELALLEGPQTRRRELALVLRTLRDFIAGFRVLHFVGPCVTIFGSARFREGHPYYDLARELGRRVGLLGFTVLTGGGPGLMEAANRGARDVGRPSMAHLRTHAIEPFGLRRRHAPQPSRVLGEPRFTSPRHAL
jgi:SLOG cluster4 family